SLIYKAFTGNGLKPFPVFFVHGDFGIKTSGPAAGAFFYLETPFLACLRGRLGVGLRHISFG
ncbi:MAG: hypothetical protein J6T79_03475, partial [Verrucomicrobia bacterium]|nr:hypothetical protein [Verrucomicrobiota bacterium]